MRNFILTITICLFSFVSLEAQKCASFIPVEQGTVLKHSHFNKKGKLTGISELKVDSVSTMDSATFFKVKQKYTDPKGKDPVISELDFKCVDETFYVDMSAYIDKETIKAYEDLDMAITASEMYFPGDMIAGQRLNDGSIKIEISAGTLPMNFNIDVKNRLVEDIDSLSTPAGKFPCIRISEDVVSNFGFMKFEHHLVSWYSENIGTLRSETYKNEKLISYIELTEISKD
jgi:hypothetical protein